MEKGRSDDDTTSSDTTSSVTTRLSDPAGPARVDDESDPNASSTMPRVTMPRVPGTPLVSARFVGRFRIDAELGSGGMADVFRAYDPLLDREVALKVLHTKRGDAADTRGMRRVLREARAAAALTHPNTVTIFEVGEADDDVFIAMELLRGHVLREVIVAATASLDDQLRWLLQAARALAAAHERGLVHRDVKPENMFVCTDGTLKLLDFGIAKRDEGDTADSEEARPDGPSSMRTQAGRRLGTPRYMAPEQHAGVTTDARTDEYAWGLVAFELLTGSLAAGEMATATMEGEIAAPVGASAKMRLSELRARVPLLAEPIALAIARALEREPHDRFPSMAPIVEAFDAHLSSAAAGRASLPSPSATTSAPRVRRPRWHFAVGVVVAALFALAAARLRARANAVTTTLAAPVPPACRTTSVRRVKLAIGDRFLALADGSLVFVHDLENGLAIDHETPRGMKSMLPYPVPIGGPGASEHINFLTLEPTVLDGIPAIFAGVAFDPPAGHGPVIVIDGTGRGSFTQVMAWQTGHAVAVLGKHVVAAVATHTEEERYHYPAGLLLYLVRANAPQVSAIVVEAGTAIEAPSLATTSSRLGAAYVAGPDTHFALLGADLVPAGDVVVVAPAPVAPALVLTETHAAVFWARRHNTKTRLEVATMRIGETHFGPVADAVDEAIIEMLPAVVPMADGSSVITWVATRNGDPVVRVSPVGASGALTGPSDVASAPIIRDLAATPTERGATITWQDGRGLGTVAEVTCQPPTSRPDR